ncbi:MAG: DUF1684 domain-containing protein [Bacteroidales bacterium]|nr:DUF1684 domain-containing protein [Bacteroidales bacterium]MCF8454461.1 DUF1684 domain-containing protein [Bacteroidales bacterium]
MKTLGSILLIAFLAGTLFISCNQKTDQAYIDEIQNHQKELNEQYADSSHSPLSEKDLKSFTGLGFFPIDPKYRVDAEFVRTPNEQPFGMKTTTDRLPMYMKYGIAKFDIGGKNFQLSIFQNLDLVKQEGYEDYLFLPFTDLTSGVESYGGGRYIDLRLPDSDHIIIDFNKAYNPYCAYNHRYSCPVPPVENDMNIEIKAGVKAWAEK